MASVEDAVAAMAAVDGHEVYVDGAPVSFEYGNYGSSRPEDWICEGCRGNNFQHRKSCFQCGLSRNYNATNSPALQNTDDESPTPTEFLLLCKKNDFKEILFDSAESLYRLVLPTTFNRTELLHVWIVRDVATKEIKDFAFVQYSSIQASARALTDIRLHDLLGRAFRVTYGRDLCAMNR